MLELPFFDEHRARAGLDDDAAEVFAVERVERDAELRGEVFADAVQQQIMEEQLVAVAALLVDGLVVVLQADDRAVVADADEQGAAVAVEEGGDGLDDDLFELAVLLVVLQVPARRRLELDARPLALCQQSTEVNQSRCYPSPRSAGNSS
ncbi:hypothetical protein L6Q96_20235 [Candidatus Binatia bacterium]|nr:hypothetical protein [Candidatus Binatia bacterium]